MFYAYWIDVFSLKVILKESKHVGIFKVLIVKLYVATLCILLVIVSKIVT
jgi:hypothetical protein